VALVISLAMLGAGVGMRVLGVAGNLMSLGALDFGLLVDGAVVMVEHIFHEQLQRSAAPGTSRAEFISRAGAYVARPTLFSVLTILLVYVPVLSLSGVDGKMFRPMALVVVMALGASLLLSLTYIPAATALWLRARDVPERVPWLARQIEKIHRPVLRWASAHPKSITTLVIMPAVYSYLRGRRAGKPGA